MSTRPDARLQARRESLFRWSLLVIFGLIALAWLLRGVFEEARIPDNYTNGFSGSPGGHKALVELLKQNQREVRVKGAMLRLPEYDFLKGDTLVLLEPRPAFLDKFEDDARDLFEQSRKRSCSLVFAFPKRFYRYHDTEEDGTEVVHEGLYSRTSLRHVIELTGFGDILDIQRSNGGATLRANSNRQSDESARFEIAQPVQTFVWKRPLERLEHSRPPEVLLETETGEPVAIRLFPKHLAEQGGVVLISDPDLLSNRWLGQPGAGTLALVLFRSTPRSGTLVFEETLHGFSSEADLENLALTPPGLWVTLSVLALMLLFAWRQATVLRPFAAEAQDRQSRLYAVDGLARMMQRARDHHSAYRALIRRSNIVLGQDPTSIMGAGSSGGDTKVIHRTTGRVRHVPGNDDEERLLYAAARVADMMRRGEAEHAEIDSGAGQ